eukprot:CAMPEP_0168349922 /NCGR_PEP_ID=MMETSP0213-20121227/20766_1 /TAXON_ID=151035 /ORGANISM="Euplotes harpa, Strain FSP1.4" /LENGTH=325 /DNA_ID=CAMNT_0008360079 /DNA_START=210 /DNA_END=1187 /DNA_ORIENTATION=-
MGAMKVWIDTSKDSVAVPHLDGAIRIKLLKLPSGVRVKEQKAVPQSAPKQVSPVKEKTPNNLSAPKPSHIPHSNSQSNIADHIDVRESKKHKYMSEGGDDDIFGHNNHHSDNIELNEDLDDLLGHSEPEPRYQDFQDFPNEEQTNDLLGDFDTVHQHKDEPVFKAKEPAHDFGLAGGLGDLGGLDFNLSHDEPPKEEKKSKPADTTLSDHVKNVYAASEKEKDEWQIAYQKYDDKIKIWKGHPNMNSIKVLLCTLHDVLWPSANWKRVAMHEVIDQNAVKKTYRKAILITHPDRQNQATTDQKFLANRVFGTLNEAWKVFEQTGQ